jgi:hypothetical protein
MNKPVKVYELYPANGGLSVRTIDYRGEIMAVAAVSVKQAYYYASNDIWADNPDEPAGILWTYDKWESINGPDHTFWNGTKAYGGGGINHMDKKQAISRWMKEMEVKDE